jgi:hypothetical protein
LINRRKEGEIGGGKDLRTDERTKKDNVSDIIDAAHLSSFFGKGWIKKEKMQSIHGGSIIGLLVVVYGVVVVLVVVVVLLVVVAAVVGGGGGGGGGGVTVASVMRKLASLLSR